MKPEREIHALRIKEDSQNEGSDIHFICKEQCSGSGNLFIGSGSGSAQQQNVAGSDHGIYFR